MVIPAVSTGSSSDAESLNAGLGLTNMPTANNESVMAQATRKGVNAKTKKRNEAPYIDLSCVAEKGKRTKQKVVARIRSYSRRQTTEPPSPERCSGERELSPTRATYKANRNHQTKTWPQRSIDDSEPFLHLIFQDADDHDGPTPRALVRTESVDLVAILDAQAQAAHKRKHADSDCEDTEPEDDDEKRYTKVARK
ncbi:hypothetical protein MIND_01257000 [Mycena indigotica]|uniref:Uncharacterized protein n=1 Tax=Mycena indigotica TaxID=2126181 RepID=A0A8H6VV12_9AGAR|nr:uncharacterized protein MIND_01257000 [Mycena indigotica]KAF7291138.1 hypothetical protein MIND_01257000 [Mycena indigotica]